MARLLSERGSKSGKISHSKQLLRVEETRRDFGRRISASASARPQTAPAAELHALILIFGAVVVGFETSNQEAKTSKRGGQAEVFQPDWARVVGRGRGAEDRQECPRRRDPLSTDRSLIKPYGRYPRGTRTSLRSVRALMDLCGKYCFVFFCN